MAQMASPTPGSPMPDYRTPRLFGILNVVFASALLIYGLCMGSFLLATPLLGKAMKDAQKKVAETSEKQRTADLEALKKQAAEAKTSEEKAELEDRRKQIEARPKAMIPGMMDLTSMVYGDPRMTTWYWVEIVSGLAANLALLASGIGLVKNRGWGRGWGLGTAAFKCVRLVLLYGFFALAIVPTFSKTMGKMVGEMMAQQQQAMGRGAGGGMPDAETLARIYSIMYSAMSFGMIGVGVIYPLVLIWALSRPGVRAAFAPTDKGAGPSPGWAEL